MEDSVTFPATILFYLRRKVAQQTDYLPGPLGSPLSLSPFFLSSLTTFISPESAFLPNLLSETHISWHFQQLRAEAAPCRRRADLSHPNVRHLSASLPHATSPLPPVTIMARRSAGSGNTLSVSLIINSQCVIFIKAETWDCGLQIILPWQISCLTYANTPQSQNETWHIRRYHFKSITWTDSGLKSIAACDIMSWRWPCIIKKQSAILNTHVWLALIKAGWNK